MITLTLLHANHHDVPVQSWTFEQESVIRIGRATDNHVVLYSAVVSRHHAELRQTNESTWEVISLGTNGTYLDGKRVNQSPILDGGVIRLARSGPNIRVHLGSNAIKNAVSLEGNITFGQRTGKTLEPLKTQDSFSVARTSAPLDDPPGVTSHPSKDTDSDTHEDTVPVPDSVSAQIPEQSVEPQLQVSPEELSPSATSPGISGPPPAQLDANRYQPANISTAVQRFDVATGQPLQIRQVVGEYQVLEILGQGGMGITYLAWRNGQSVVLKTLNPEWINHPKALELFSREARVLQELRHPGIPRLLDFFSVETQPYLVMEIVYGETLQRYVERIGPVSEQQAIAWLLEVCDVLTYLHSHTPPILHRDIKPDNLIRRTVPRGGKEIAVVDFGAVKYLAMEAGTHIGSAGYTAPEQQGGHATSASDLYALGPTLIYLLTGQDPSLYYKLDNQEFRFRVDSIPNITSDLKIVIETLTEPNPELRYQSALEVSSALRRLNRGA